MTRTRTVDGHEIVLDYDSPRITSETYECALPMTFDQYSRCAFGCKYCFAAFIDSAQQHAHADGDADAAKAASKYRNPVRAVDPDKVMRLFTHPDEAGKSKRLVANLIKRRAPLHWGGLCDPFDPFEKRFQIGLELLKFFRSIDWPVVFSTKGILMCEGEWAETMRGGNFRFQHSITTLDAAKAKVSDSGVSSPHERLLAMRFVTRELGCVATLRLRPIVPGFLTPEQACELIEQAHANGATGVSTEFFCMEARGFANREKYLRMSEAAGFDLFEFYRRNSPGQSGYLRLNRAYKETFFLPMARTANKLGMRFSVSDTSFKELGNVDGCCGVYWNDEGQGGECTRDGHASVFLNKGTITYALIFARKHGRVRWSDVEPTLGEWAHSGKAIEASTTYRGNERKSNMHREQTLFEALRGAWNDPNNSKSPYRYSQGKVRPLPELDEHGDVVYEYTLQPGVDDDETLLPAASLVRHV